jgi:hypothetical protein
MRLLAGGILMNQPRDILLGVVIEKKSLAATESKNLNEDRMDKVHGTDAKGVKLLADHVEISFHCECNDPTCTEMIMMSTEEYRNMHRLAKNFVVVPKCLRLEFEEIVSRFSKYIVVAKYDPPTAVTV